MSRSVTTRVISILAVCFFITSLLIPAAFAQETTAALEGHVKDQTGAVISGATVTVSGPALIGEKAASTDSAGYYHFINLPPGVYTVSVKSQGFGTIKQNGIQLDAGKQPTVDISMKVGSSNEVVEVSGEAPLVDVTTAKTQVNIDQQILDAMPKGRSFQSLIQFAPGARNEPLMGGYVLDGASKSENAYLVEGQETASVYSGESNTNVPTEFIQEVQVKSSGFEAEFGGALGGVVNVIQPHGSNAWHGSVFSYYSGNAFDAGPNKSLQNIPGTQTNGRFDQPNYFYVPKQDHYRVVEPGFTLGGPIFKNRLWTYVSAVPRLASTSRTVNLVAPSPTPGTRTFYQDEQTYYTFARLDYLLTQKIRLFGSWQDNQDRVKGAQLPGADSRYGQTNGSATQNADNFNSGIGNVSPRVLYNFGADITITPRLIATSRFGRTYNDYQDRGLPVGIRYQYSAAATATTKALDGSLIPTQYQNISGFATMGSNSTTLFDKFDRKSFNQDMAWFHHFAGSHNFKWGYQFNQQTNQVLNAYNTARVLISWNRSYTVLPANQGVCAAIRAQNTTQYGQAGSTSNSNCRGDYGYYRIRDFGTTGNVGGNNHALYVQDSWTVGRGVTLELGIRADQETLPSYNKAFKGISFGFGEKVAPRLGGSWDVLNNGKLKVYGHYAVLYDIMKINLPSGSFGGDYWHDCAYTLDSPNFNLILPTRDANGHNCPLGTGPAVGSLPGRFIENDDFREPSNDPSNYLVDPKLKPMREHSMVLGTAWEINRNLAFESNYTRKRLDRTIEDAGIVTPAGEQFYIVNPGEGINVQPVPSTDCTGCPPQPGVIRNYDAVEFRLVKRPTGHWFGAFTYLYSRLYGNYNGLSTADVADGVGRANPNNNRSFDEPFMQFDANGKIINGPLDTDRPNTFKLNGFYKVKWFGFETDLGLNQYFYQGTPLHSYFNADGGSPQDVVGRGNFVPITQDAAGNWSAGTVSAARMPWYNQTDFNLIHFINVSKTNEALKIKLEANILNLFNQHAVTNIDTNMISGATGSVSTDVLPGIPSTSISGVNYKAMMTGYDWVKVANLNGAILNGTYGKPNGWQGGRSMRFYFGFQF